MKENETKKLKVTVEHYGYTYSAEGPADMNIDQLIGRIITPLMLNIGYQAESIKKLFIDGLPSEWDSAWMD